jgi:predicted ATPase/transcriptional regulator with XRE-family HTH domain
VRPRLAQTDYLWGEESQHGEPTGERTGSLTPKPPHDFGEQLRRSRARAGLSQEVLAARTELTAWAIAALERGRRQRPYPDTVRRLADVLALSPEERDAFGVAAWHRPTSAAEPPATQPPGHLSHLPVPLTNLIGRDGELAGITALLAGGTRLVTLTGPGGIGKTRLALAVADRLVNGFPDGVAFVDLAPLREPRLVPATMARAVQLSEAGGQSARELLLAHLRAKDLLLVLDNFEHLLAAAPLLVELLEGCPRLTLLVTSRAALRLRGERRFPVRPLSTPPTEHPSVEEIAAASAVRLFVERAQAVDPDFTLSTDAAGAVAAICRRLDGLPLAIELAAARMGLLQPDALLRRLDQRLPLLTGGARDLPARQQTLRNTIAWSHELLSSDEQALLRRMGVFIGGCTLAAVEAVCGDGEGSTVGIIERLGVLVEHSLVRRLDGGGGEPRFDMLETVHEYALEQCAANGEESPIRRAHAHYMLHFARVGSRALAGPKQTEALQRMELDYHNLRAALTWALNVGEGEVALQLCAALSRFWYIRGYYREGREWSARALAAAPQASPATRAAVLEGAGSLADMQRDPVDARRQLDASVALWRTVGDGRRLAAALAMQAMLARHAGDTAAARAACEEALTIDTGATNRFGHRLALSVLGFIAEGEGDRAMARQLLEESLLVARANNSAMEIALQLNNLGIIAVRQGDNDEAAGLYREALQLGWNIAAHEIIAGSLEGLGAVTAARGRPWRAAELLGAAAALRARIGGPPVAQFAEEQARVVPLVHGLLGDEVFSAVTAQGATVPLADVVTRALAAGDGVAEDDASMHAHL